MTEDGEETFGAFFVVEEGGGDDVFQEVLFDEGTKIVIIR